MILEKIIINYSVPEIIYTMIANRVCRFGMHIFPDPEKLGFSF